ncbi:hypothetical protein A3A59_02955 [Candidatus Gottesmanbacteria bacterium RIFCSPLOWO2_01_FULL_42_10]|nr:MAG: hypothetical protein A3A59_02955 [Candidatus Gottesmanbacteria bacterium RIFCSPLOWO2_01_FULL_42_10]
MRFNLTGHMIVRNEEQWVWYAIQSVINHVDELLIFDTGSDDKTNEIIKSIASPKITFVEKGRVTPQELADLRNEQIKLTRTDWFLLLDGDEIWPQVTIGELVELIKKVGPKVIGLVVNTRLPLGDLFHYQSESAGHYQLLGKRGHFNIRCYRKTPIFHWECVYPYKKYIEKYVDRNGIQVQDKTGTLTRLNGEYWHLTHLVRSSQDTHGKRKYEIGQEADVSLPEVFYLPRQTLVPDPWIKYALHERIWAQMITPLKLLKRRWQNVGKT